MAGGPSGELLADLGTLLVHSAHELIDERGLIGERQQVLRANPELFSQRMASMKEFQAGIQTVVEQRLRREDGLPGSAASAPSVEDDEVRRRARLASLVGMAALRHAWWEWSESDADAHLVDELERSFADLGALVSRSLV